MPAVLVDEPLGIECSFSDGRRFRWTLKDDRCPVLARDLLAGLADLVYPHGSVDSPSTANIYRVGLLHMLSWMSDHGLAGGAAALTRGRLAEYWMCADRLRESTTRAMLASLDDVSGALEPGVRELVAGRPFHPTPRRVPLQPYTETEWARLIQTCRRITKEAHASHMAARVGAASGRDPRGGEWSEENLAWLMSRDGPMSEQMFAEPKWAHALWIRVDRPDGGRPRAGRFDRGTKAAWGRRNGVTADDGAPLALHLHRIRVSWHSHRDRTARHGSARATIDPNHSPAV